MAGSNSKFKEDTKKKIFAKIRTARDGGGSCDPGAVANEVCAQVEEEVLQRGIDPAKFLSQMEEYARWVE